MEWTNKNLREDLETLKRMYKLETDIHKKEELIEAIHTTMYNICDLELGNAVYPKFNDPMTLFNNVPKFTMYYPYVYEFYNKLATSSYDVSCDIEVKGNKDPIKREEIFPFINDFYKSLGKKVYNAYLEVNRKDSLYINYDEDIYSEEGYNYFVPILNKRYMMIGTGGDTRDVLATLTHEMGHAIATVMNPKRYYSDDFFTEIESLFFEMVGLDYYYNQTDDSMYSLQLKEKVNNYFWNSANVLAMKRTSDKTFANMKDILSAERICEKELLKEGFDLDELIIDVDDKIKYLVGYIVAVELFEIYKEDKDLSIDLLERIINRDKNISEYSSIVGNITPNKSLVKHLERVNRY